MNDRAADHEAATVPDLPRWQRWLPRAGAIATGFTALCCIGVTADLSLASAVGASFLLNDSTLKPALLIVIGVTIAGSTLTYRAHRNLFPLMLTIAAGAWIYWFTFIGVGHVPASESSDHMVGMADGTNTLVNSPHWALVWAGLAVFVAAQVWDLLRVRACRRALRTADGQTGEQRVAQQGEQQ